MKIVPLLSCWNYTHFMVVHRELLCNILMQELTLAEAETIALSILKQVMEEKVTPNNVDIAKVAPNYHLYTPAEVEAVIARL
uniref:PSA5 n=1 Tax=Arundo donax TaxID=35708 RepID=A0A0A9D9F4_ARUDO